MKFYHTTNRSNLLSIMQHGLIPHHDRFHMIDNLTKEKVVHLALMPTVSNTIGGWLRDGGYLDANQVTLEVDIPESDVITSGIYVVFTTKPIPPNRIRVID